MACNAPASCSAVDLIASAVNCGYNKLSDRDLLACILAAACAGGGSSGGVGAVMTGAFANPNGNVTPADTAAGALYYPIGGGTLYQWDTNSQTWV